MLMLRRCNANAKLLRRICAVGVQLMLCGAVADRMRRQKRAARMAGHKGQWMTGRGGLYNFRYTQQRQVLDPLYESSGDGGIAGWDRMLLGLELTGFRTKK